MSGIIATEERIKQLKQQLQELDVYVPKVEGNRTCMVKSKTKELMCIVRLGHKAKDPINQGAVSSRKIENIEDLITITDLKLGILSELYQIADSKEQETNLLQKEADKLDEEITFLKDSVAITGERYIPPFQKAVMDDKVKRKEAELTKLEEKLNKKTGIEPRIYYQQRINLLNKLKQEFQSQQNVVQKESTNPVVSEVSQSKSAEPNLEQITNSSVSHVDSQYSVEEIEYRRRVYAEVEGILDASIGDSNVREQFLQLLKSYNRMYEIENHHEKTV